MLKTLFNALKLKKTHNKISIVSAFFLFFIFLSVNFVFSAIIKETTIDDFENYSNGYSLVNSDLWEAETGTWANSLIIGTNAYSGNFGINATNGSYRGAKLKETFSDDSQFYTFYTYLPAVGGQSEYKLDLKVSNSTSFLFYFVYRYDWWSGINDYGFCIYDDNTATCSSEATGIGWYKHDLEIDLILDKVRIRTFNVQTEVLSSWTDWRSFPASNEIKFSVREDYNATGQAFDNFSTMGEISIFDFGYDIGIEITSPEIGTIIEVPTNNATTTGNWEVQNNSTLYWGRIYAVLKDLATGNNILFYDAITGTAGSDGAFSIDLEDIPDGNYSLCWASTGDQIPYITKWVYFYCEEDNRTILRVGDYPELPRYILLENYQECDYEDCEELDLLEKLVCGIKNFIVSLTCPSPEKLLDLKLTIDEMKNKFPISYLKLAREEYNFLRDEISEKEEIILTIFGNEAKVDISFFENIKDGNDISLMDYLKIFINGLLGLSFIMYGFYFIKRIF